MIKKKGRSRLVFLLGAAGLALSVFLCPASNLPVHAATTPGSTAQPQLDIIEYRYICVNYKVYKRLYNYSTGNWIGDWIFVREISPEEGPPDWDGNGDWHK